MDQRAVGLLIAGLGAVALVIGGLIAAGWLGWFGRLPGDINVKSDGLRIFVPITSMLVVSVVVSAALYLIRRLL